MPGLAMGICILWGKGQKGRMMYILVKRSNDQ